MPSHTIAPGRNVAAGTATTLDAASGTTVRNHNLTMLANTVVTGSRHPSRADLARMTGLNRSTMTRLVEHLISCGIIRELNSESTGSGRPAVPLAPALHTYAAIGVDISTGSVEASAVDLSGEILAQHYQQLNTSNAEKTLTVVRRIIDDLRMRATDAELTTVGITVALHGLIATNHTYLLSSPNLGCTTLTCWRNCVKLRHRICCPKSTFSTLPMQAPMQKPICATNRTFPYRITSTSLAGLVSTLQSSNAADSTQDVTAGQENLAMSM